MRVHGCDALQLAQEVKMSGEGDHEVRNTYSGARCSHVVVTGKYIQPQRECTAHTSESGLWTEIPRVHQNDLEGSGS